MDATYRQSSLGSPDTTVDSTASAPVISIGVFMDRLERQGVTFDLVGDDLRVEVPFGALSEAQRHELVARRDEVERLVRVALGPLQPIEERVVADDRQAQMALGQVA